MRSVFFRVLVVFDGRMPYDYWNVPIEESEANDCTLSMVNVKTGRNVHPDEKVSREFLVYYMLGSGERKFYFTVKCQDGRIFRSREVVLGGKDSSRYYNTPLDIGTLIEVPQEQEQEQEQEQNEQE